MINEGVYYGLIVKFLLFGSMVPTIRASSTTFQGGLLYKNAEKLKILREHKDS